MKAQYNYIGKRYVNDKWQILFESPYEPKFDKTLYDVEIEKHKEPSTADQKKVFWQILNRLCFKLYGNCEDVNDIYKFILKNCGVKLETINIKKDKIKEKRQEYRYLQILDETSDKYLCEVSKGISDFNTREMSVLIDYLKDYCVKCGVNPDEV